MNQMRFEAEILRADAPLDQAPQQREDAGATFTLRGERQRHERRREDAEVEQRNLERRERARRIPARPGDREGQHEEEKRHVR